MNDDNRGDRCAAGSPGLLHNMSAPPETTINFKTNRFTDSSVRIRYLLPAKFRRAGPSTFLRALGDKRRRIAKDVAEGDLRLKLEKHAGRLKLPAVAAVIDQAFPGDEVCTDLLTVLTVFSRISGHVYVRDRTPNLYALTGDKNVVLILPTRGDLP